jgi:hypothetical protein
MLTEVRSEIKEAIVLLVFTGLMVETLNGYTISLIVLGSVMVFLRKRPSKIVRNVLTVAVFVLYWMIYGKVIDPEVGINFLTTIILLKLMEKDSERDRYMIFFGLVLLISAGSLFQKSLSYVFFFGASFSILILDFYKNLKLSTKVSNLVQSLLWVLPLATLMFFLVPRMMNPFQLQKGSPKGGEIGYTPEVNISEVESLDPNDSAVFQAAVNGPILGNELYWRGNTLSFSDGWNWPVMPQDRVQKQYSAEKGLEVIGIKQNIRTIAEHEFFFGLDHPSSIKTARGVVDLGPTRTLSQNRWQASPRYEVISQIEGISSSEIEKFNQYRSGLSPSEEAWIHSNFKQSKFSGLQKEIQSYFQSNKFSYSLAPGRVVSFSDFMKKKIGFCSHFSSAVGIILRTKKIPVRLVSGFLGGSYNRFAGFYLITQNDAHVWVEAFVDQKWIRLDPTDWIAPDRIKLGGEAFMAVTNPGTFRGFSQFSSNFGFIRDWQQWFSQWDFKFYQWLEDMDYYGQEALLEKLRLQKKWIYSLIPLILAVFMGLYIWQLSLKRNQYNEIEKLWKMFQQKMHKRGIVFELYSIEEIEKRLLVGDTDIAVRDVWKSLLEFSFGENPKKKSLELRRQIQKL